MRSLPAAWSQRLAHEGGVAGAGAQVLQAGEQVLAAGVLGGQAGADARTQGAVPRGAAVRPWLTSCP
jgi:hypothetical protein